MITNDAALKIIMDSEGLMLEAYKCPAGVWTVGYGHTRDPYTGKPDVEPGRKLRSKHEAEELLTFDLQKYEEDVGKLCPKGTNGNQFSACVSLAYNIGVAAFEKSTLLKKLKAKAPLSAAEEFLKWVYAGKNPDGTPKKLNGLVKRRAAERALFLQAVS